jgi:hypothetical protein
MEGPDELVLFLDVLNDAINDYSAYCHTRYKRSANGAEVEDLIQDFIDYYSSLDVNEEFYFTVERDGCYWITAKTDRAEIAMTEYKELLMLLGEVYEF